LGYAPENFRETTSEEKRRKKVEDGEKIHRKIIKNFGPETKKRAGKTGIQGMVVPAAWNNYTREIHGKKGVWEHEDRLEYEAFKELVRE